MERYASPGDEVRCTYEIKNMGTQTLSDFCLVDLNLPSGCVEMCKYGKLSPGNVFSCSTALEVRWEPTVRGGIESKRRRERWRWCLLSCQAGHSLALSRRTDSVDFVARPYPVRPLAYHDFSSHVF